MEAIGGFVIDGCAGKLLSEPNDESLECVCTLFKTVGAKFEAECKSHDRVWPRFQQYFVKLNQLISHHQISSRIRFMMKDLLEMRENEWRERQELNPPPEQSLYSRSETRKL